MVLRFQDHGLRIAGKHNVTGGAAAPNISPLSKFKLVFLGDKGEGKTSILNHGDVLKIN